MAAPIDGDSCCLEELGEVMKTLRVVELTRGGMGLTTDSKAEIMRREGANNVAVVRDATEEDVAWVRGMGGYVPREYRIAKAGSQ